MADYKLNPLLTDAAWQKNKGAYAKMAGETGMGAALAVIAVAKATDTKFRNSKLPNISTGKKAVADILKAANDMESEFKKKPYKLTYNQWDDFVKRFGSQLK
jgi:hypothetical protein